MPAKLTIHNQHFLDIGRGRQQHLGTLGGHHLAHGFIAKAMQVARGPAISRYGRIQREHTLALICQIELAQLYPDQTTRFAKRRMVRPRWIADIAARGIPPVLVTKLTRQHDKFLPKRVVVIGEGGTWGIAHQTGGHGNLTATAIQHHPFDTGLGRGDPPLLIRRHRHRLEEIGKDLRHIGHPSNNL